MQATEVWVLQRYASQRGLNILSLQRYAIQRGLNILSLQRYASQRGLNILSLQRCASQRGMRVHRHETLNTGLGGTADYNYRSTSEHYTILELHIQLAVALPTQSYRPTWRCLLLRINAVSTHPPTTIFAYAVIHSQQDW